MKAVLMIGQSNMAGRGFLDDVPMICNEKIHMLRNGRWQMMTEPINNDRSVAGVSLAGFFAALWSAAHEGEDIGLIPCAEGGSALEEWAPEGKLFRHAVMQSQLALEDSELIAILWHQGENDSYHGLYKTYYEKLDAMVAALRTVLDALNVPFVIGGLGDYLGKQGFGLHCTEYAQVNQELQRFANDHTHTYFVSAEGLTCNPDGIHLDAVSQRRFGVRYYEAFTQKRNVLHALEDEDARLAQCLERPHTAGEKMYLAMTDFARGKIDYATFQRQLEMLKNK